MKRFLLPLWAGRSAYLQTAKSSLWLTTTSLSIAVVMGQMFSWSNLICVEFRATTMEIVYWGGISFETKDEQFKIWQPCGQLRGSSARSKLWPKALWHWLAWPLSNWDTQRCISSVNPAYTSSTACMERYLSKHAQEEWVDEALWFSWGFDAYRKGLLYK